MTGLTTRKWCSALALHNYHDVRILSMPTVDVDGVDVVYQWNEWPRCTKMRVFESLAQRAP